MKDYISILLTAVVLSMLCACQYGSVDKEKGTKDSDSAVIHIAVLPTEECRPFYVAQQRGLYDSLGVVVQLDTFMAAMDADTAFMNDQVQLLVSDSLKARYLNRITRKDSIIAIITDTLRLSVMTGKPTRIKSISSLKEKIIAVTRNSAVDYFADQTMDKAKIKREYLNRPQINNIALRADMLNLNQYDGAILPEPFATQCEEQGAYRINSLKAPLMRVLVKQRVMKKQKQDIQKIIEAYSIARHVE
ncbi:MAG: ABC transporter substrate-binding protein [Bacteroidaceae bacterium]|nr:ABC transporter substrate-binding protein [Bacteroidaceae bacterium]